VETVRHLDALRAKVAEMREAFERAASASVLHDGPAKDQLLAMGLAMDAMLQICEGNDASRRNVMTSREARIGEIAGKATERVVDRGCPHVADAIERPTQFHLKMVRLRALLGGAAARDWASPMADNDPVEALNICEKSISTDAGGRRYCLMPVLFDPATLSRSGS
jgi:hypothetical protein